MNAWSYQLDEINGITFYHNNYVWSSCAPDKEMPIQNAKRSLQHMYELASHIISRDIMSKDDLIKFVHMIAEATEKLRLAMETYIEEKDVVLDA